MIAFKCYRVAQHPTGSVTRRSPRLTARRACLLAPYSITTLYKSFPESSSFRQASMKLWTSSRNVAKVLMPLPCSTIQRSKKFRTRGTCCRITYFSACRNRGSFPTPTSHQVEPNQVRLQYQHQTPSPTIVHPCTLCEKQWTMNEWTTGRKPKRLTDPVSIVCRFSFGSTS